MYVQQQYQSASLIQQKSSIQKLLDDNSQLISLITDLQSKGKQNECIEYQRTLHRNLSYLTQFDLSTPHPSNNLPLPDGFIQTQQVNTNGNTTQSDQMYRSQANTPSQTAHNNNTLSHPLPVNASGEQQYPPNINSINKLGPRTPFLQHGNIPNSNNSMDASYSQAYNPQQSYPIQQNNYGQYPMYHRTQQNLDQLNSVNTNSSSNPSSNEQQNYLIQQQWHNQSRMPIHQQSTASYQQHIPPQS